MRRRTRTIANDRELAEAHAGLDRAYQHVVGEQGKRLRVIVEVAKKRRNVSQNARLWALYTEIQRQIMERHHQLIPTEEIHDECKRRILGMTETAIGMRPCSTATLVMMMHAEYQDHVQRIAAQEWGVDWKEWENDEAA